MNNKLNNALKPCPFCGGKRVLKRQQRKLYQATQWRGYIAKNARAHQQVLMIIKKTALFCLMQSKPGTAVSERRTTMTKFIEAKKKNHGWI